METPLKKICPHCKKGRLAYRAKRPPLMKTFLFWLPIKRYSCGLCSKKTYVYGSAWETTPLKNTSNAI